MSNFNEIVAALNGRKSGNEYMACCPAHDDSNPSLSIKEETNGKMLFHCHAGCSQEMVMGALKSMGLIGLNAISSRRQFKSNTQLALSIWNESKDAENPAATPLRLYLDNRGLKNCTIPPTIRLHPSLPYYAEGKLVANYPALIGRVNDKNGTLVAVQRIYLTKDGHKAAVTEVKKSLGPVHKNAVYLDTPSPLMAITEGIETALAVRMATQLPTLAAISAKGMEEFELPSQIQELHIFADRDASETGQKAAKVLAEKLNQDGKKSVIHLPEEPILEGQKGVDWLDVWNNQGQEPFNHTLNSLTRFQDGKEVHPKKGELICLSDVKAEEIEWLWNPYIPIGKLTMIEGDPGLGKSWILLAIAAHVTRGKGLPGTTIDSPSNVLLLSAEDGLGDTIKPRLLGMDADHSRIFAPNKVFTFDEQGILILEKYILEITPKVIIIDPLVSYMGGKIDMNRANETRQLMTTLGTIASRERCSLLLLRHLTKGSADKSIYRGIGSIDLTGACRSVLLAGADDKNPANRALIHIKCNIAKLGVSQGYALENGKFSWTGESNLSASDVLSAEQGKSETNSALGDAITFLESALIAGERLQSELTQEAEGQGISKTSINRAKKKLGILARRENELGMGRGKGKWFWRLPPKLPKPTSVQDVQDTQQLRTQNLNTLNESDFDPYNEGTLNRYMESHSLPIEPAYLKDSPPLPDEMPIFDD